MDQRPAWIELMFKRGSAAHSLLSRFLLDLEKRFVLECADAQPHGRRQLRLAALAQLEADQPSVIALALIFLLVVGQPADIPRVENLLTHADELVRKAAMTCLFEIKQRMRKNVEPIESP